MIGEGHESDTSSETLQSSQVIRLVNLSRVVMYFSVTFVQFVYLLWQQLGSLTPGDTMLVLVPLFLGMLDFFMVIWSRRITKRFWQAASLVSLLAILVSAYTLAPIFATNEPYTMLQSAMLVLGIGIFMVSVLEKIFFRVFDLKEPHNDETGQPKTEIKTY